MCSSNEGWDQKVSSSRGDKEYLVSYERLPPNAPYQYGFVCNCHAFKFGKGKECKHILSAKKNFCGWHEQFDSGSAVDGKCPRCSAKTVGIRCAV